MQQNGKQTEHRFSIFIHSVLTKEAILFYCILFIALFLRLFHFSQRFGFGSDDSRDIMLTWQIVQHHIYPFVGSFSSAGPFLFGGNYYLLLAFSYVIFPFTIFAPQFFLVLLGIIAIGVLYFIGKELLGSVFGFLLMTLGVFSPHLITRSIGISQHSFVWIGTIFLIYCLILLWKKQMTIFALLAGFFLGMDLGLHYQSLNLLILFLFPFLLPNVSFLKKVTYLFCMLFGFFIIIGPIVYWDSKQSYANMRNILDYFLIGEYRIYVPNSWRLYLLHFLPNFWANEFGGSYVLGFFEMIIGIIFAVYAILKRDTPLVLKFFFIVTGILLIINRYYRGERSEGYLLYLTPFLLLLSAYAFFIIGKFIWQKGIFGRIFLILFSFLMFWTNFQAILPFFSSQSDIVQVQNAAQMLEKQYPQGILVYDYHWLSPDNSYPLAMMVRFAGKETGNGYKVGVVAANKPLPPHTKILMQMRGTNLIDLSKVSISKKNWYFVNSQAFFKEYQTWNTGGRLTSSFSLQKYLNERLRFL